MGLIRFALLGLFFVMFALFVFFLYTLSQITGNPISGEDDIFSRGLPRLSPEILPDNRTLDDSYALAVDCERARGSAKSMCDLFIALYPKGCSWWHFEALSSCRPILAACLNARNSTLEICS